MSIARLSIDLVANIAAFEAQMTKASAKAEKEADRISQALGLVKGAAGALVAGISIDRFHELLVSTTDYADTMGKLAQKAGVATEAMSALAYAGRQADVDQDTLAKGLRKLGEDATEGGKGLKALGISIKDATGGLKSSDKLLQDVADVIAGIEDPALRAATAVNLFGSKVGPELVPLLSDGAGAIKELTDEARRFGRVVDDEAAKRAAKFNDNMQKMSEIASAAGQSMGNAVLPVLTDFTELLLVANRHALGFLEVLTMVGGTRLPVGGLTMGTVVKDLVEARRSLEGLEASRQRQLAAGSLDVSGLDQAIAAAKRKLEYLKELQRGLVVTDGQQQSAAEGRRLGLVGLAAAPAPSKRTEVGASGRAARNDHDASAQALAGYVDQMQRAIEASQDLTEVERAGRLLKSLGTTGEVEQVRELVLGLAQQKDAVDALKLTEKDRADEIAFRRALIIEEGDAINRANTEWQNYLQSLDDQTPDGRLERQRKLMADLAAEFEAGRSSAEQFNQRVQVALGTLPKDLKDADDAAEKLGLTFSSAFEDAIIKGSSLKDVVNSLGQDVFRIAVRKAITEPMGKALGGFFETLFSFDGGGYTGNGPRSGGMDGKGGYLAMLHPQETVVDHTKGQTLAGGARTVVINQTNHFDRGANRSEVMTAAQLGAAMARNQVRDDMARGRL